MEISIKIFIIRYIKKYYFKDGIILKMLNDFFYLLNINIKNFKLILRFSLNDFLSKYSGTVFGILWSIIVPFITILNYWFVFSFGLKMVNIKNYTFIIYLISGIIPWFFFSDSLITTTIVFKEYSYLVKKVLFNIEILPTIKIFSNLYMHLIFIIFGFLFIYLFGNNKLNIYNLQIFYYLFCLLVLLHSITWFTSSIQVFFSDIFQIINVFIQILIWSLPILWEPFGIIKKILKFNPIYYVIQGYRESFLEKIWFWEHWKYSIYFWLINIILLFLSSIIFRYLRKYFSDVL